jgi:hypothetical protein
VVCLLLSLLWSWLAFPGWLVRQTIFSQALAFFLPVNSKNPFYGCREPMWKQGNLVQLCHLTAPCRAHDLHL